MTQPASTGVFQQYSSQVNTFAPTPVSASAVLGPATPVTPVTPTPPAATPVVASSSSFSSGLNAPLIVGVGVLLIGVIYFATRK